MRILDALFMQANANPARPAMGLADRMVTYDMLARGILSVENRAKMSGVRPRDLVVVAITSPIRHMIVVFALMRLGAISVSVDDADGPTATQLQPDWLLIEDFEDVSDRSKAHLVDDDWFYGFTGPLSAAAEPHAFDDDEVCRLFLSSGATGTPKALAFTPRILADRIYTRIATNADCHAERTMIAVPIGSQMGWGGAVASLVTGGFVLFALTPETTLQMIDIYGVTNLVATTSQIRGLLEFNQKAGFPTLSLRTLQTGGGLASPALYRRIQSELCQRVVSRFSATETGCIAVADTAVLTNIEGATGFITPWARVEIVDDHGAPLPRGRQGFIRVNTNAIAPAWTRDMAYVQSVGFSWFDPGDIGMIDERGLLFVHGRASNVINIGGAKIPAETIEALLLTQAGVREAGVVSIVGPSGFEEIHALVVGDGLNAEALREAVNPKLGQTPVTRVIVAPSLPKNANGKLLREELRKLAAAS